jgi:hypothetical protein
MYTLGLSGLSVAYHYCGDTLMYVELASHKDKKGCRESCCGEQRSDDCCKDKLVKLSMKEHKQTVPKFILHVPDFDNICINTPISVAHSPRVQYAEVGNFHLRPPPLRTGRQPLYILHSVFRI